MDMAEGHKQRQDLEWDKLAWLAAWTIRPHVKGRLTPSQLLGKNNAKMNTDKNTKEQNRQTLNDLENELLG